MIRQRLLTLSLVGSIFLGVGSSAQAKVEHLDLEVGTDLAFAMNVTLASEWPHGIRLSTSVGYMPELYVALINEVVQLFPYGYDDTVGNVIEQTLKHSLVWRTHVGWAFAKGWYIDVGYGLGTLGGGATAAELLAVAAGRDVPNIEGFTLVTVGSTLHMIDAEIGWKGLIFDKWTLRTAIGFAGTLSASAAVDSLVPFRDPDRQAAAAEFETFSEDYLVDTYTRYVFAPVLTVAVGYRFF